MSEKLTVELGNVQKTLFLPLWGRAVESKKEKPLLVDKTALQIAPENLQPTHEHNPSSCDRYFS